MSFLTTFCKLGRNDRRKILRGILREVKYNSRMIILKNLEKYVTVSHFIKKSLSLCKAEIQPAALLKCDIFNLEICVCIFNRYCQSFPLLHLIDLI